MSKKKFSIPTMYKGIQMRSRLEADIAFAFDKLGLRWEYEKKSFLLSDGTHYYVDFYLPDLKTWLEGKGVPTVSEFTLAKLFVKENNTELAILSRGRGFWFSTVDPAGSNGKPELLCIGKCSHCGSFYFCGKVGTYSCRGCGKHEGDHDILCSGVRILDKNWLKNPRRIGLDSSEMMM